MVRIQKNSFERIVEVTGSSLFVYDLIEPLFC